MSDVTERLRGFSEQVDDAVAAVESGGGSPVLLAVVRDLQRKMAKAIELTAQDGSNAREAVIEIEQAADSAKYAAEADEGLSDEARRAVVDAHDRICVFKAKLG